MLEIDQVSVRFGPTAAVSSCTLVIPDGAVTAVMGPSGSGKTTLLRAVAGIQHVDEGTIRWNGTDLSRVPPHRRRFALMFQDYALFPHRSVAGNIAFGLRMQRWDEDATSARVSEILDLVGLSGLGDRRVGDLSGGQQQRVALGRTLAPEPRLVLLDEPLGSLDRVLRDQLIEDMRAIFETLGTTVLYVTHDRDEAFAVADVVAVMGGGTIVRTGTPETLWNDPGTIFVAGLLGLDNIVTAADLRPWLPVAAGDVRTAIVPGPAIQIAGGSGGEPAVVVRDRFQGGSHRVTVRTGSGLELHAETSEAWAPGTTVTVSVVAEGIRFLA